MKVVIVEDEPLAAEKLERHLAKCSTEVELLAVFDSIVSSIPWIIDHQDDVDLFFMDIQLRDGLSFEIFSRIAIVKPVIFTTAFDEYAIDAFKVNSIDYLLKPISFIALNNALEKYEMMKRQFAAISPEQLSPVVKRISEDGLKSRFLVKKGRHIRSVLSEDVRCFYAEGRDVFLLSKDGGRYIIDYKMEDLVGFLSRKSFFRINRSLLVHIDAIQDVVVYSNRRLKLNMLPDHKKEAIVAREKVQAFRKWFDGDV